MFRKGSLQLFHPIQAYQLWNPIPRRTVLSFGMGLSQTIMNFRFQSDYFIQSQSDCFIRSADFKPLFHFQVLTSLHYFPTLN